MNRTPPAAISQTSFPSQNGPIDWITRWRSASVLPTKRRSAPAPKSKPSRTAYAISVSASTPNHSSIMGCSRIAVAFGRMIHRTVRHLATDQEQVEDAEHEVEARESDQ